MADVDSSLASDGSRYTRSDSIDRHCDEVESNIAGTRQVIIDMVKEAKVGRHWAESLNRQLDEIMVGNHRLGRTGSKVLGSFEEQREELRSTQKHLRDLYCDLGALREQLKQVTMERDSARVELSSLQSAGKTVSPPMEFMDIDDDCFPSGASYAE